MSTTTIRLTSELKARIQRAADAEGLSAHALILEAIAEKATASEQRTEFYDTADARLAKIAETGQTISWADARASITARMDNHSSAIDDAQ